MKKKCKLTEENSRLHHRHDMKGLEIRDAMLKDENMLKSQNV